MIDAYINNALPVHGAGITEGSYIEDPDIYLDIKTKTSVLTPFNILRNEYDSRVLLAESIIVGDVPETYYFYDDLNIDSILDAN